MQHNLGCMTRLQDKLASDFQSERPHTPRQTILSTQQALKTLTTDRHDRHLQTRLNVAQKMDYRVGSCTAYQEGGDFRRCILPLKSSIVRTIQYGKLSDLI